MNTQNGHQIEKYENNFRLYLKMAIISFIPSCGEGHLNTQVNDDAK